MAEKENITKKAPELRKQAEHGIQRPNEGLGQRAVECTSELKEREKRYQTIFNTMIEGFCVIEVLFDAHDRPVDYRFLEINPAFEVQTGLRNAQGKRMRELAPEHEAYWFELYGKIAMTGEPLRFENEAKALHRWFEVSAYRIGGRESSKVAILFNDITERKQAEAALRESEERHGAILKSAMDGFWRSDLQGHLLEVNETYCRMSGYTEQELLTMRISDLEAAETTGDIADHMQRIMVLGENRFESRHRRKDGSILEVEISVQYKSVENRYMVAFLRDITERKRAGEELIRSKADWERTFDAVPDLIALIDRDYRIIRVNRAMAARMGKDPRELVGSRCFETVHGLSAPPDFCPHAKLLASGKEERAEVVEKRLNGIFDVIVTPLCDEAGRLTGSVHIAHDITERKQEEVAVRESEERHRTILNTAMDGFYQVDMQGRLMEVNDTYCSMSGYSKDELLAMKISDLDAIETADDVYVHNKDIAAMGGQRFESRHRRKDGSIYDIEVSTKYQPDYGGRFFSFIRDITERKRTEDALCQTQAILQAAMDQSPAGIAIADAPDGVLRYVNDAGLLIRGGDRQSIVNGVGVNQYVSTWQLLDLDGRPLKAEEVPLTRAILFGETCIREFIIRRADNDDRIVSANAAPIKDTHGMIVAGIVVFADITDQKRTEEQLYDLTQRLTYHINNSPVAVIEWGGDMRLVRWAGEAERIFGWKAEEVLGKRMEDFRFIYIEDKTHVDQISDDLRTGANLRRSSLNRNYRKDGTVVWCEWYNSSLMDQSGKMCSILSLVLDVSKRKRAEDALRESEHEKTLILENASESIAYHDTEQNLIWANRAYQAATMPLSELKGRKCYICWGLERLCVNCPVSDAIRTGAPQSAELTPQNQPHWPADQGSWLVRAAPVKDSAGIVIGAIEIAHDITETKRTEEELRVSRDQLRELAASLQTVREEERTRVARDIHDELAQELTRLKIDLVWMKGRLLKPGKVSNVKALAARVEEMTQMADDAIQCVQKIATGLRPAVLDSLGLCAAVEWQARDFQVHTGISCNASLSEKELPIGGDIATAVFRILQESLTNVLRHANATSVDIVLRQEAGQLLLQIHDNGCGIPEEKLNSQMSIGLTDMKERALLLGGHFEVRSRPESGTTIEVRLPLEKNENI